MSFKIFVYLLICINLVIGQSVQVKGIEKVTDVEDVRYYHPKFMPDGESLILTQSNYLGLVKKNLATAGVEELNMLPGAGYEPLISKDGKYIYYHANKYAKGRRYTSLISQNILTKESFKIEDYGRHKILPTGFSGNRLNYLKNSEIISFDINNQQISKYMINESEPMVTTEKGTLVIHLGGEKRYLKPVGDGHYIWPSLSPDKKRLLFTKLRGNWTEFGRLPLLAK